MKFYGIFSKWKIDYELIQFISKRLPDFNFIMIGPDYDQSIQNFNWNEFPNLYFLGKKTYPELPNYARFFDVALLPFLINDITNAISPVKLFEYLAMNLPVVSTNIAECRKYKSVLIASDYEDYLKKIKIAIPLKYNSDYQEVIKQEIAINNWDYHCQKILLKIDNS